MCIVLFTQEGPFRTTIRPIYPHFAQFLAGAAHPLEELRAPA